LKGVLLTYVFFVHKKMVLFGKYFCRFRHRDGMKKREGKRRGEERL
jgi:hypothetical protein